MAPQSSCSEHAHVESAALGIVAFILVAFMHFYFLFLFLFLFFLLCILVQMNRTSAVVPHLHARWFSFGVISDVPNC